MTPVVPTVIPSVIAATTPVAIPIAIPLGEADPSSRRRMKQVLVEVPDGANLLKKSNSGAVWLKPLIGPLEREKLESHTSITLMNDVIQSTLKVYSSFLSLSLTFSSTLPFLQINLTGKELMWRIAWTVQQVVELRT